MRAPRFLRPHARWRDQLDAYVDGELGPSAARAIEGHLAECGDCSQRVSQTRALKSMLAGMPEAAAPRSFRLSPEMVALKSPVARPRAANGAFRVAQFATGFAIVALIAVAVVDFDRSSGGSSGNTAASTGREAAADQAAPVSNAAGAAPAATLSGETPAAASPAFVPPTTGGVAASGFATPTPAPTALDSFSTPATPSDAAADSAPKSAGGAPQPGPLALRAPESTDERDLRPIELALAAVASAGAVVTLAMCLHRRRG